jgi:hypothetical protein
MSGFDERVLTPRQQQVLKVIGPFTLRLGIV